MKKTWMIIAAAAALCAACNDDSKACTEGYSVCDISNTVLTRCINGSLEDTVCKQGQVCNAQKGKCVTAAICSDSEPATCQNYTDNDGIKKTKLKYCSSGDYSYTDCGTNGCIPAVNDVPAHCAASDHNAQCKEGAERCTLAGEHQICDSMGTWVASPCCPPGDKTCAKTCEGGKCVSTCIQGQKKCGEGNAVRECRDGIWEIVEVCSGALPICAKGECVDASHVPENGDPCDGFISSCEEGIYRHCVDGVVAVEKCNADPFKCVKSGGIGVCVLDIPDYNGYCKEPTEGGHILFQNSCDESSLTYLDCIQGDDGNTYSMQITGNSVCDFDKGQPMAITCDGVSENPVFLPCNTCDNKSGGMTAVCDGKDVLVGDVEGGTNSGYYDCSDETLNLTDGTSKTGKEICGPQTALCDSQSIICVDKCSAAQIGQKRTSCSDDKYTMGNKPISVTETTTCTKIDDTLNVFMTVSENDLAVCVNACAASMKSCDEQGVQEQGGSGADDAYYNCNDENIELADGTTGTGKEICGPQTAVCTSKTIVCVDECSAAQIGQSISSCSDDKYENNAGQPVSVTETATCTKIDDTLNAMMPEGEDSLAVCVNKCAASMKSCDEQGVQEQGGSGTNEYGLYNCSDEKIDKDGTTGSDVCNEKPGTVAICDDQYIYCMDSCTSSEIGNVKDSCVDLQTEGSYAVSDTCIEIDSSTNAYVTLDSTKCKTVCNADNTACK